MTAARAAKRPSLLIALLFTTVALPIALGFPLFPFLRYDLQGFVADICLVLLAAAAAWRGLRAAPRRSDVFLCGFLALYLLSFLLVRDHLASLESVLWWLEALVLIWIVDAVARDGAALRSLLKFFPALGAFISLFVFYETFIATPQEIGFLIWPCAMNRNFLAQLLILPLVASLFGALDSSRKIKHKLYPLACLILIASAVLLTRSRAVWLSLALVLLAWTIGKAFNHRRTRGRLVLQRRVVVRAAVIAAALGLLLIGIELGMRGQGVPGIARTLRTLSDPSSGSAGGRLRRWSNALPMIRDNLWIGVGPGNWSEEYLKYSGEQELEPDGFPFAYNTALEVTGEAGIFAALLLIGWFIALIRTPSPYKSEAAAPRMALCIALLASLFHTTFKVKILFLNVLLIAAMLRAASQPNCSSPANKRSLLSLLPLVAMLVVLALEWRYLQAKITYYMIRSHLSYSQSDHASFSSRSKLTPRILNFMAVNAAPGVDYRSNETAADAAAAYGSGRMRSLYLQIAVKELLLQRPRPALAWLQKAAAKSPNNPEVYYYLCAVQKRLNQLEAARASCGRALELNGHDARIKALNAQLPATPVPELKPEPPPEKPLSPLLQRIMDTPLINKQLAVLDDEVFYASNQSGRFELWSWKPGARPKQISNDGRYYFRLRTLPERSRLYFVSDNGGNGRYDIYYRDLSSGVVSQLTRASTSGEDFGQYELSTASGRLIYVHSTRRETKLIAADLDNNNPRTVFQSSSDLNYLALNHSGSHAAAVLGKHRLRLFDLNADKWTELHIEQELEIKSPRFSPDDTTISYVTADRNGYGQINLYDLRSRTSRPATQRPGRYLSPQWIDGEQLLFRESIGDNYLLRVMHIKDGSVAALGDNSGVTYEPLLQGDALYYVYGGEFEPISINRLALNKGAVRSSYRFGLLQQHEIIASKRVELTVGDKAVPLYLVEARGDDPRPTILWLHGAGDSFSPRWHAHAQAFAHSGYRFAALNYREASSRGRGASAMEQAAVEEAIAHLKAQPEVDPERIFILGVSTGAELGRSAVSRSPAAVAGLIEYSPATELGQLQEEVERKRLTIWGANDPRLSRAYNARTLGTTVVIDNEGHDLRGKDANARRMRVTLGFLDQ